MRTYLMLCAVAPLAMLSACGGGGGGGSVASTPPPIAAPPVAPPPPPPSPSAIDYNTFEYRRSNAAVQAKALTAYNSGVTGAGVTVGVIDSGVDTRSPEFAGKISSFSADLAGSRGLQDEGGHGTAVSSVLLGLKNDSGTHGVAFGSTLLVLRTDTPGSCTTVSTEDDDQGGCSHNDNAIARGVDVAVAASARVVNISLGGSGANSTLRAAINRATAAGLIIVISAGNDGVKNPDLANNPDPLALVANDPVARNLVIIAGALTPNRTLASFSNKAGSGAAHYLTALGTRVLSIDETGTFFEFSGTSFAAPVVSGAVALLAQAFPSLSGAQIVDLLFRTAADRGDPGNDAIYGFGEIDLERAFQPQGAMSLGASAVPVTLAGNATLSGPMGDAGQGALNAVVRDSYGRDFAVDLAPTVSRTASAARLAPALDFSTRNMVASGGATTLAMSMSPDDRMLNRLTLTAGQSNEARALAASAATRLTPDISVAVGYATSSDALAKSLGDARGPAFLVSGAASGDGLDRAPQGAFAMRRQVGPIGLTLAAESGRLRLWERDLDGFAGRRRQLHGYGSVSAGADFGAGPFQAVARLMRFQERETVLGARFSQALGGGGATSWFGDVSASLMPLDQWRLGVGMRQGWTQVAGAASRQASTIRTRALSMDIERASLFTGGDSIALRWSQPLRVTQGGLDLMLDGDAVSRLNLAPTGHEQDVEAAYTRPFAGGTLATNMYWRREPGNYAAAPDDVGAAVRFSLGF